MTINDIKAEIQKKNIIGALKLMLELPDDKRTAEYFLLRGICLQLVNDSESGNREAESCLRNAIELDPKYKDAKLELAYFLLNVKRDPSAAKLYFLDVIRSTRDDVPSGISSLIESTEELHSTNSTFADTLKIQAETYLTNGDKKAGE